MNRRQWQQVPSATSTHAINARRFQKSSSRVGCMCSAGSADRDRYQPRLRHRHSRCRKRRDRVRLGTQQIVLALAVRRA